MKKDLSVILIYRFHHPINVFVLEGGKAILSISNLNEEKGVNIYFFCVDFFLTLQTILFVS